MTPVIDNMKSAMKELQEAHVRDEPEELLLPLCTAMTNAASIYDDKYKGIRKALPSKAKPKAKAKAAAPSV